MVLLPVSLSAPLLFTEQQSVNVLCPITDLQKDSNRSTADPSTGSMCISFQTVMKPLEMAMSAHLGRCHEQRLAASPLAAAWCGASRRP